MFVTSLSISILALGITWLIIIIRRRNYKLPPGPRGLPFLGYFPFLSQQPYLDFAKLSKRYGNVFSFRTLSGKLIIVLNGVETIEEAFVNRAEEFVGRPKESNLLDWLSDGLGIAQDEGNIWKEHRRFFIQTLKNSETNKIEQSIQDEIMTLIRDVKAANGNPIDFGFHVGYAAYSVMSEILFSKKFNKYNGEFEKIAKAAHHLVEIYVDKRLLIVGSVYKYVLMKFLASTKRIREAKQHFKDTAAAIVDEHIKRFDPSIVRDYMDNYLYEASNREKNLTSKKHSFTRDRLHGIVLNLLIDSTETISSTIVCMLIEISKHQDDQKLVQEELDSIVGRKKLPSWTDRQNLPYLSAFLQELCRIANPFNLTLFYSNFEETTLAGYRIPKRSLLIGNLWSINNDPLRYPEPLKFDPKRFLDQNSGKSKARKDGYSIYGVGARNCVVESLVDKKIFLIVASILQNFTLLPAENCDHLIAIPRM